MTCSRARSPVKQPPNEPDALANTRQRLQAALNELRAWRESFNYVYHPESGLFTPKDELDIGSEMG